MRGGRYAGIDYERERAVVCEIIEIMEGLIIENLIKSLFFTLNEMSENLPGSF